jgi:hypothetical protein
MCTYAARVRLLLVCICMCVCVYVCVCAYNIYILYCVCNNLNENLRRARAAPAPASAAALSENTFQRTHSIENTFYPCTINILLHTHTHTCTCCCPFRVAFCESTACFAVCARAVDSYSARFCLNSCVISGTSPSSGLGSAIS